MLTCTNNSFSGGHGPRGPLIASMGDGDEPRWPSNLKGLYRDIKVLVQDPLHASGARWRRAQQRALRDMPDAQRHWVSAQLRAAKICAMDGHLVNPALFHLTMALRKVRKAIVDFRAERRRRW